MSKSSSLELLNWSTWNYQIPLSSPSVTADPVRFHLTRGSPPQASWQLWINDYWLHVFVPAPDLQHWVSSSIPQKKHSFNSKVFCTIFYQNKHGDPKITFNACFILIHPLTAPPFFIFSSVSDFPTAFLGSKNKRISGEKMRNFFLIQYHFSSFFLSSSQHTLLSDISWQLCVF